MGKHTPGPWEMNPQTINRLIQIYAPNAGDGNGGLVAIVQDCCESNREDARLIAAAPELLEVLEIILSDNETTRLMYPDMEKECRAIIAKAKGENR